MRFSLLVAILVLLNSCSFLSEQEQYRYANFRIVNSGESEMSEVRLTGTSKQAEVNVAFGNIQASTMSGYAKILVQTFHPTLAGPGGGGYLINCYVNYFSNGQHFNRLVFSGDQSMGLIGNGASNTLKEGAFYSISINNTEVSVLQE